MHISLLSGRVPRSSRRTEVGIGWGAEWKVAVSGGSCKEKGGEGRVRKNLTSNERTSQKKGDQANQDLAKAKEKLFSGGIKMKKYFNRKQGDTAPRKGGGRATGGTTLGGPVAGKKKLQEDPKKSRVSKLSSKEEGIREFTKEGCANRSSGGGPSLTLQQTNNRERGEKPSGGRGDQGVSMPREF